MKYTIRFEVDGDPKDMLWIPKLVSSSEINNQYVGAVHVLDDHNKPIIVAKIHNDDPELTFWRDVDRLLAIRDAAISWRDAIQYTDGIQRAEVKLLRLLVEK